MTSEHSKGQAQAGNAAPAKDATGEPVDVVERDIRHPDPATDKVDKTITPSLSRATSRMPRNCGTKPRTWRKSSTDNRVVNFFNQLMNDTASGFGTCAPGISTARARCLRIL